MRQYETYKCNKCGNEVEVQNVGGGTLHCCGEAMEMVTTNLTAVNLMKAFAGESQARNKYEFFAKIAFDEGYHKIARFFQEAAENEKYHAIAEFKAYNKLVHDIELDSTVKIIQYAADGEKYEHEEMYPNFEEIAKQEYILTPGRYVGVEDEIDDGIPFSVKMDELTQTLGEQFKESARLEEMIKKNLAGLGYEV